MEVDISQFHRPYGRRTVEGMIISDEYEEAYFSMGECGARFTAEVLRSGQISLCIEHPDFGDFSNRVVVKNGPAIQLAIENMLKNFDALRFGDWLEIRR